MKKSNDDNGWKKKAADYFIGHYDRRPILSLRNDFRGKYRKVFYIYHPILDSEETMNDLIEAFTARASAIPVEVMEAPVVVLQDNFDDEFFFKGNMITIDDADFAVFKFSRFYNPFIPENYFGKNPLTWGNFITDKPTKENEHPLDAILDDETYYRLCDKSNEIIRSRDEYAEQVVGLFNSRNKK